MRMNIKQAGKAAKVKKKLMNTEENEEGKAKSKKNKGRAEETDEAEFEKKQAEEDKMKDKKKKSKLKEKDKNIDAKEEKLKSKKNKEMEEKTKEAESEIKQAEEDKKKDKKKKKKLKEKDKNMDEKEEKPKSKEIGKSKAKKNEGGGEQEEKEGGGGGEEEEKEGGGGGKGEGKKKVVVPKDPVLWISVLHKGEIIPFEPRGQELTKLLDLLNGFPKSRYVIEINNGTAKKTFTQTFSRDLGKATGLDVQDIQPSNDPYNWTKITFYPDGDGYNILPRDNLVIKRYLWKRVFDTAATLNGRVKIMFDGIPFRLTFDDYSRLYPSIAFSALEKNVSSYRFRNALMVTTKDGHDWKVLYSLSNGVFQHVSFVNGLPTPRGGTHVDLIKNKFIDVAREQIDPKESFSIQNYCFYISLVMEEDPIFDSKAKDRLISPFECDLTLTDPNLADNLISMSRVISGSVNEKQVPVVDTLVDAHEAGGEEASKCFLILTEGESAKDFVMSGLSSIGNKYYGVLPLRGKVQNARGNSKVANDANPDFINIKRSLGLDIGVSYENLTLRYGHFVLMMDQDTDGSHIKGLIINFLNYFWPSLLQKKDFLFHFITPIIKVTIGKEVHKFFSIPQYDKWTKINGNNPDWKTKYYKGLGSHTAEEAKQYFTDLKSHMKRFRYSGVQDFNTVEMVFCPQRVNDRKYWIARYQEDSFIDPEEENVTYSDFLNKVMILYSIDDIKRSIPSMVDGFKPSQRKIIFSAFKKNLVEEMKVAQFSGYVCEQCAYHHSHDSMTETIIRMAQNFVGANNINLLLPIGQFGTRRQGGKSHADARYINTYLCPLARLIIRQDDEPLLNNLIEDGQNVQPWCYLPIIPMVLVNGCEGIATGWNTRLPPYHPLDIIDNIKSVLNGGTAIPLLPWFRGFQGSVDEAHNCLLTNYEVRGALHEVEHLKVEITELPVSTNTDSYKSFLREQVLMKKISSFQEDHKGDDLKFILTFTEKQLACIKNQKGGLEKYFKMDSRLTTDNIYLMDQKGSLKKYFSANEVLLDFIDFRLPFYEKRKELLVGQYEEEIKRHRNIERFVRELQDGVITLTVEGFRKKLLKRGYESVKDDKDFNHIRDLSVSDLMSKRENQELALIEEKWARLKEQTPAALWLAELSELEKKIKKLDKKEGLYKKEGKSTKRKGDDLDHSGEKRPKKD